MDDLMNLTDDELSAEIARRRTAYSETKTGKRAGDPNTASQLLREATSEHERREALRNRDDAGSAN